MTVEELAALVREYFAAKDEYNKTDGGRWLNLKGAARQAHRKSAFARFIRARDTLDTAMSRMAVVEPTMSIKKPPAVVHFLIQYDSVHPMFGPQNNRKLICGRKCSFTIKTTKHEPDVTCVGCLAQMKIWGK